MRTVNPFGQNNYSDQKDLELIHLAVNGNRNSLSKLIENHQQYIFNIALKMVNNIADAEDITQEILIKLVTNLSQYDSTKGRFRTWLYRITFNHFLNIKKQKYETLVTSFDVFFDYIRETPEIQLTQAEEKEMQQEIEESKVSCMAGMLMCLDREQRLIYIVGELFEIDHNLGSEIFNISPANFRKKLSRARNDLYQWMHNKCGLVNTNNPCRCPKKTKGFIANGWVNPEDLKWQSNYQKRIIDFSERNLEETLMTIDDIYAKLYKEHPFKISQKTENIVEKIINNNNLKNTFNLEE
ncbi:RNA polymerase sigma factor [Aquimarina celericrescens]|uniref:RNA polymerase sigma factor n=1 Tax=Aquimarina celericrescens TaxID=1964542 RepID=A0ABW5B0U8_9FLAO|nr:RNA polymerase sigma factor [Aquimarina celericrescens]